MANTIDKINLTNFDGVIDDFSVTLQEAIKNIIKEEGYVKYTVEKKVVLQTGNFTSFLFEVDIIGVTNDGERVTSLFIKKSFNVEKLKLASITDLYSRERFVYNDLFSIFAMLQDAANVPDIKRFKFLKTYNSDTETIVMENLSKKGFKIYNKTQIVPLKFAELSIIQLAKFHALSYVVKTKIPKFFDDNIKSLESPLNLDSDWEGFVHNICDVTVQVLKGESKAKMRNFAPRLIKTYNKYIKERHTSNGCLCHGDYKFHNIMVKEVDGEASAVQPIDYQLIYYGTPVDDFLFFMFTGTDREFRRKHLSNLKELYFQNFSEFLKYFNLDVNSTYSREEFENDYKERFELGLTFGLYLSAFTFAHIEGGFDVTKLSMSELPIIPDDMFAERVSGIVEDYIDWGYL